MDGLRVVGCGRPCCLNAHSQIYFLLYVFVSSVAYDPEPQHSGNRTQRSPFPTSQPRILCNAQPGKHIRTYLYTFVMTDLKEQIGGGRKKRQNGDFLFLR